ncbi:Aste57867_11890 [Aphanomyces stellatus]|uniref:Aste57867_11890 protein n=1 Tax=Aphanomyces stellatus TaxID=120398 RepID=A0A485KUS5_9STRA|nr:hypothetical protein As57867_011845 [Aphanomyces stellatus]VFT88745.1 Aste57867_11890 [Aphanomyces stellatus]
MLRQTLRTTCRLPVAALARQAARPLPRDVFSRTSHVSWLGLNDSHRAFATHHAAAQPEREIQLMTTAEVKKLCLTTKADIIKHHGKPTYFTLMKRLKHTWKEFYTHTPYPTPQELKTFWNAAKALEMDTVLVETTLSMREIFPKEIKTKQYLDSRIAFLRLGKFHEMIAIFESEKLEHPHPQPIFYIWALTAYIEQNNIEKIKALLQEMKQEGYMVPNETVSRLLFNLATRGDKKSILEILPDLDPNVGIWTVPALNRTLTSLGMVGLPAEAFKFYGHSTMELDPTTFKTVLEVAVRNRCIKEATDILHNRRLFDLTLDTPEYNVILEALILLKRTDEIPAIVAEMEAQGVTINLKTRHLMQLQSLDDKVYNPARSATTKNTQEAVLRKMLDKNDFAAAAAVADGILAKTPTPKNIKPILEAYVETKQLDKLDAIVASMQTTDWPSPMLGLIYLIKYYCQRTNVDGKSTVFDPPRAFQVYLATKRQNVTIWQPVMLYPALIKLGEWEAAVDLFYESLALDKQPRKPDGFRSSQAQRSEALTDVVRFCAKVQQYDAMREAIEKMLAHGHRVSSNIFKSIWFDPVRYSFHNLEGATIQKRNEVMATFAAAIASSLKSILAHDPSFQVNYELLDHLLNVLFYGKQQQMLLELYRAAKHNQSTTSRTSTHVLHEVSYQKLLQVVAIYGRNLAETRALYDEARRVVPKMRNPALIDASMIRAIAQAGRIDEMLAMLEQSNSGSAYRGALEALLASHRLDQVGQILDKMVDAGFQPNGQLVLKAMQTFLRSRRSNPAAAAPVAAFLGAFEAQIVVNGTVQTKSPTQDGTRMATSMREIRTIYSTAVEVHRMANDDTAADAVAAHMKELGIEPIAVEGYHHRHM